MSKSKSPSAASPAAAKELVEKFVGRVKTTLDSQLETLAGDLYKAFEDPSGKVDAKKAIAQIAKALQGEPADDRGEHMTRLLSVVRTLDEANSLRALLEGLGRGAAMEATRVAVLLVDGDMLRPFADFGIAVGQRPTDIVLDSSPIIARAVRERIRVTLAGARNADLPPFMKQANGMNSLAVPVVVGGDVVSLIYAEGPVGDETHAPSWMEYVEVLTRHAAARLEAITSRRTVEVLGTPA
jgi:hypothetical protein